MGDLNLNQNNESEKLYQMDEIFSTNELNFLGEHIPATFIAELIGYIHQISRSNNKTVNPEDLYSHFFHPWKKTNLTHNQLIGYLGGLYGATVIKVKRLELLKKAHKETPETVQVIASLKIYAPILSELYNQSTRLENNPIKTSRDAMKAYIEAHGLNPFWNGEFGEA